MELDQKQGMNLIHEFRNKSIFENKESFSFGYNEIPKDFL
jgi:hypothetical protein